MSLLRSISSLFGGTGARFGPPRPDSRFYAIGDIHGRLDLLTALTGRILAQDPQASLVFVGDYIDRGEDSSGVLAYLRQLGADRPGRTAFLAGNHEQMCLQVLDDPEQHAERWLRYGGLQTLASYGVGLPSGPAEQTAAAIRDGLAKAMGPAEIDWLRGLSNIWISGNVAVVHAAADPDLPIEMQPDRALLWGHPKFDSVARSDGFWVVHGHTIVDQPHADRGRIAIDTGAYATGRLTAARIDTDGVDFIST